jgi:hypothetical protein
MLFAREEVEHIQTVPLHNAHKHHADRKPASRNRPD